MAHNRDDYTEAHNRYYPLVFSAIHTKIENIDDARDITQEVFVRFFEKFDQVHNHRKWLYGTLRLAVFEFYRQRTPNVNIDEVFTDMSLTFVNGFRDARIIIAEALENMENFATEEEKTIFDLVAMHTFSYTETGRQMGLTKRQVEYKYKNIVGRILEYLKKKGINNIEELL